MTAFLIMPIKMLTVIQTALYHMDEKVVKRVKIYKTFFFFFSSAPSHQWHGGGSCLVENGTVSVLSSASEVAAVLPLSSSKWRTKSFRE